MIHDMLVAGGFSIYAQLGLVLFVALFAGIVLWTFAGQRDRFKYQSEMPLEDGAGVSDNELKTKLPRTEDHS